MARWKNRYARKMAKRDFNRWWRNTYGSGKGKSPQDNSGCATGFLLTLAAVVVFIWAL